MRLGQWPCLKHLTHKAGLICNHFRRSYYVSKAEQIGPIEDKVHSFLWAIIWFIAVSLGMLASYMIYLFVFAASQLLLKFLIFRVLLSPSGTTRLFNKAINLCHENRSLADILGKPLKCVGNRIFPKE